jgi:hypothetical protein
MGRIATRWLPPLRISHPWPQGRFLVEHPHQGIARHQVIEPLKKQHRLLPISTRDERRHPNLRRRHLQG